jgi:hypothetical protein
MVVPLTDWKPQYANFPWFVSIPADSSNGLNKDSGADAFQTKSVSLARFVRSFGGGHRGATRRCGFRHRLVCRGAVTGWLTLTKQSLL